MQRNKIDCGVFLCKVYQHFFIHYTVLCCIIQFAYYIALQQEHEVNNFEVCALYSTVHA